MGNVEHFPALVVVVPLLSAFAISIVGLFNRRFCHPFTVAALLFPVYASVSLLREVMSKGPVSYHLGNWAPPFGIEYVVDHLNALVLTVVSTVGCLAALYSKKSVEAELPDKIPQFYTLFVLLVTGLLGMTVTGDAFNLYVLVEIAALTGYALIAVGTDRALVAGFNYVMLGTIGACFYLLGVGHLYIMTGSLNMGDLHSILPSIYSSHAIMVAFILILVGLWAKMAFFPLHSWLPNAYTYAPTATAVLVAPLVTKVSVYVMIRIMYSVFSPAFVYGVFTLKGVIQWLAVIAIVAGALMALAQTDFRRMLTYLVVSEVGYMVGGVWLANANGVTGAVLHIVNDALMTLCLFMVVGVVAHKTKGQALSNLKGLYSKMPVTMAAFTLGALSMIGVPPTAGFFSKWYLLLGAIDARQWGFMAALLFSSLANAVLFFRAIEIAYYEPMGDGHGHGPQLSHSIDEAPPSMLIPLVSVALSLVVVGIYTREIILNIVRYTVPAGL